MILFQSGNCKFTINGRQVFPCPDNVSNQVSCNGVVIRGHGARQNRRPRTAPKNDQAYGSNFTLPDNKQYGNRNAFGQNVRFGRNCIFGHDCHFGSNCVFGMNTKFGKNCTFGSRCQFAMQASFNRNCWFGEFCIFNMNAQFGSSCTFGHRCQFDMNSTFGHGCSFGIVLGSFGMNSNFGGRCDFTRSGKVTFGMNSRISDHCLFSKAPNTPMCIIGKIELVYHPPQPLRRRPQPALQQSHPPAGMNNQQPVAPSAPPMNNWTCTKCTFINRSSDESCLYCKTPNVPDGKYSCTRCTFFNDTTDPLCKMCGEDNPAMKHRVLPSKKRRGELDLDVWSPRKKRKSPEKKIPQSEVPVSAEEGNQERDRELTGECVICLDRAATHAIVPCGHQCLCDKEDCHKSIDSKCPLCRKEAVHVMKIFVSARSSQV